jgi:hypothetical protein
MKLVTVIASNVFQLVGELSNSRSSVLTASVTQEEEEEKEQKSQLQQQALKQQQEEQRQQPEQQGRQQEQGQAQQKERKQQQEKLEPSAQVSHQAQLDGLVWVGWHCLHKVCTITDNLTHLLSCIWEQECRGTAGGERQGREGEIAAGADEGYAMEDDQEETGVLQSKATSAAAAVAVEMTPAAPAAIGVAAIGVAPVAGSLETEAGAVQGKAVPPPPAGRTAVKPAVAAAEASAGRGAPGAVAGSTAPPAAAISAKGSPADTDEYLQRLPKSASLMGRCLSRLEDASYAEGLVRVPKALAEAVVNAGKLYIAKSQCRLRLLQELSNSGPGIGAGAALREEATSLSARREGAETAAGSGAPARTTVVLEAGAKSAGAAAARKAATGAVAAADPLVRCAAVPAVLADILAAAAPGFDTEVELLEGRVEDGSKSRVRLRGQIVEARRALVAHSEFWGRRVQNLGSTAAAVDNMALDLLNHVSSLACIGLGRPVGFSCYNPVCGNLQGSSEVGLVVPRVQGAARGEGAGVCGRCKAVCYCSRFCQWHHLKGHLPFCRSSLKQQQQEKQEQENEGRTTVGSGRKSSSGGPRRSRNRIES